MKKHNKIQETFYVNKPLHSYITLLLKRKISNAQVLFAGSSVAVTIKKDPDTLVLTFRPSTGGFIYSVNGHNCGRFTYEGDKLTAQWPENYTSDLAKKTIKEITDIFADRSIWIF